jgi:hypothetical protein
MKAAVLDVVPTAPDINSKRSRVEPIFGWLRDHGGRTWPQVFLGLVDGLDISPDAGELESLSFEKEVQVSASPERLAWMIENAESWRRSTGGAGSNFRSASSIAPSGIAA